MIASEDIDCGWLHSGTLMVATSAPQVARLHEAVARRRGYGIGEDDLRVLEPGELARACASPGRGRRGSRRTAPASIPRGSRAASRSPASGAA